MAFIGIILALFVIGLTLTYWFVSLPLAAIIGIGFLLRNWNEKRTLPPAEYSTRVAIRKQARSERWARWGAQAAAQQEAKKAQDLVRGKAVHTPISQVGRAAAGGTGNGLACPRCGGTAFKARRSTGARVGIATTTLATGGLAGLGATAITKQKQVQCVTCGARYARG